MKQKQKVIEAMSNDCKARCHYINGYGETCAIGCLAQLANFDLTDIQSNSVRNGDCINSIHPLMAPPQTSLMNTFRLLLKELRKIQYLNDAHTDITARRSAVIDYINSLPDEDT